MARKISEQAKIEAGNLLEEVQEILSGCVGCGLCKARCPMFKTLHEEAVGPRGKIIMLNEKLLDKIIFQCNLCRACEEHCLLGINITDAILKAREAMVLKNRGLKENKKMVENVKKTGNPFGEECELDKLYCC